MVACAPIDLTTLCIEGNSLMSLEMDGENCQTNGLRHPEVHIAAFLSQISDKQQTGYL